MAWQPPCIRSITRGHDPYQSWGHSLVLGVLPPPPLRHRLGDALIAPATAPGIPRSMPWSTTATAPGRRRAMPWSTTATAPGRRRAIPSIHCPFIPPFSTPFPSHSTFSFSSTFPPLPFTSPFIPLFCTHSPSTQLSPFIYPIKFIYNPQKHPLTISQQHCVIRI